MLVVPHAARCPSIIVASSKKPGSDDGVWRRAAIKLTDAAEKCVKVLVDLIETKVPSFPPDHISVGPPLLVSLARRTVVYLSVWHRTDSAVLLPGQLRGAGGHHCHPRHFPQGGCPSPDVLSVLLVLPLSALTVRHLGAVPQQV
eukprot:2026382-Rhodomonas_salina.1